jgi:hypothetical protein
MKDYSNINWEKLANEYIETGISLTQMSKKYEIGRWTLTDRFKKLGIDIVNKQNEVKFDNTVFDVIDSEEKAYWLGLIYADGYISSQNFNFELCLKGSDIEHLNKFNKFMKHRDINHVKLSKVICKNTNKECSRCRWIICDKHLWNILNSYGCTPQKSTILKFPNINIFKDLSLIKHFIRGYFDGDGSFSRHLHRTIVTPHIQILGTPEFLNGIEEYSDIIGIRGKDKRWTSNTEYIEFHKEEGIKFINYIYENSKIYLDRKYKLFNFFRNGSRSLQEWNELLQTENGEVCDDNPVLNSETKESESV